MLHKVGHHSVTDIMNPIHFFLLTNANGNPPTKFPHNKKSDYALGHHFGYRPVFGDKSNWDLYISSESNANTKSGCQLTKDSAYLDILRLEEATFTGSKYFQTKEIEFFKLADIYSQTDCFMSKVRNEK